MSPATPSPPLRPPPLLAPPAIPGWATDTEPRLGSQSAPEPGTLLGVRPDTQPGTEPSTEPAPRTQGLPQLRGLPLTIILTIQAVLTIRLLGSNSAFNDEALYLWAGRLEWSHWLHHTPVPAFPTYFSGAPVIYPPVGAIANAIGGLTGARVLSLLFMLGATVLLHGLTKRIFDRRSAAFAAALFAGLGSTQFIGSFATYDAMAVFLLALATWLGVLAAGHKRAATRVALVVLAAMILVAADASKYAAALFDPVVLGTIGCFHWHALGRRAGLLAAAAAVTATTAGITVALGAAGSDYWAGVTTTTLARPASDWPAFGIAYASLGWVGAILVLATFGAITASLASRTAPVRCLVWTLVVAGCLAPAEQARIGVFTSLFKHVAFGGWFAAPVAGYALTMFIRAIPAAKSTRALQVAVGVAALSGLAGVLLAADHFGNWADSDPVLPVLTATLQTHPGSLLVDATPPFDYYLTGVEPWQAISSTPNYGPAAMASAIRHRSFSVIMVSYAVGGGDCGNADPSVRKDQAQCLHNIDIKIVSDIIRTGGYRLIARIPYKTTSFSSAYMIWARQEPGRGQRR